MNLICSKQVVFPALSSPRIKIEYSGRLKYIFHNPTINPNYISIKSHDIDEKKYIKKEEITMTTVKQGFACAMLQLFNVWNHNLRIQ
jgi:hypothetical protein